MKPIKINPAHKGEFTAKAKKSGTSVQALAAKDSKPGAKVSPATKKQAVFAKNAAKWNKGK
jgi:predicted RecB family endonuclease